MTDQDALEPPSGLEDRVVESLRARGLLDAQRRGPRRIVPARWAWPAAIAAGLLLFAGGFTLGRVPVQTAGAGMGRYTLLLYEGPGFNTAGKPEAELVAEYTAWAGELAGRGSLVAGEKLAAREWILGAGGSAGQQEPAGFFIIAARTDDEALAIARSCPHLRYGGTVAVRPVEPT